MRPVITLVVVLVAVVFFIGSAVAQEVIIYPAKGQSQQQMEQDKFQCYGWAKQQSGFDPMEAPKATTAPPSSPPPQGSVARGAVRGGAGGALVGAGIGAIAGDTGKGAAIGAVAGGTMGGVRSKRQKDEAEAAQKQWSDQEAAKYSEKRNGYNRAYSACLEGRGYTVK